MILPTGFGLPPLLYLLVLVGGVVLFGSLLWALEPPIDQGTVVALMPWMAIGGALHAFNQEPISAYDAVFQPLFGTPAVYLTTFITVGATWVVLSFVGVQRGSAENISRNLGLVGTGVLTVLFVVAVVMAVRSNLLSVIWPTVSVVVAAGVALVTVAVIAFWRTPVFVRTRYAAPVVVFSHALDGVSTAVGTDVLGIGERSPLPREIMEFAGSLPTAPVLGTGWLFILVKLVVAVGVVVLMHQYLEDEPAEASLLVSFVAAVGLGPATNNVVLFLFLPQ
ncbi:DUF63 family protein [Halomicroarcula sp. GCM10025324]|uniref:DUF63 family protein n=1 Tax=Haloarcula TaxID=2237 RepID=UPI0023E7E0E3|nr:DUF63 family protein [Halomicroarcula sp. ZS-22-S1]